jgi:dihydropteroate synthase
MVDTGWPVLVSLSRKDFVGEALGLTDPNERLVGTLAATSISSLLGARMYRVHDVSATKQTLDMERAIAGTIRPRMARRALA